MGIELILAEFIPIYGLSTSCREQGGCNGGCQTLHVSTHPYGAVPGAAFLVQQGVPSGRTPAKEEVL